MYASAAETDRSCLRQGDILDAVLFPIFGQDTAVLGTIDRDGAIEVPHPRIKTIPREHRNQTDCFTLQLKARLAPGAVLAHCCELELRNGRCLLPAIPIARLISVKPTIIGDASKIASLRANKDPRNTIDPGYLDYFYLPSHELIGGIEKVVDFSQISSVPGDEYQQVLKRKVMQLEDRERVKFKIKLAAYLGRLTDEEHKLGLENPWLLS